MQAFAGGIADDRCEEWTKSAACKSNVYKEAEMTNLQLMIAFGLAGVVVWNQMRIVQHLDEITRVMRPKVDPKDFGAPVE